MNSNHIPWIQPFAVEDHICLMWGRVVECIAQLFLWQCCIPSVPPNLLRGLWVRCALARPDSGFQATGCGLGCVWVCSTSFSSAWTSSHPESALHIANGRTAREQIETRDPAGVLSPEISHCLLHLWFIGKLQGQAQHEHRGQEF